MEAAATLGVEMNQSCKGMGRNQEQAAAKTSPENVENSDPSATQKVSR